MNDESIEKRLASVYSSKSCDDLAEIYRDWAETYEDDIIGAGYSHPMMCLPLFARHVTPDSGPVLDAGCGTGLIGPWLKRLGYPRIEGFDASDSMLTVARRKNVYATLRLALLGETLPFADNRFAATICMGVFTSGHVGVEGLDDLLRVIRSGGILLFTVNEAMYEQFRTRIDQLCSAGHCDEAECTDPYTPTPGELSDRPIYCRAIALRMR